MKRAIRVEVEARNPDESFERLIKRFIKKVKKERVIEKFLEKRYYEKPSLRRKKEAKRRQKTLEKLKKKNERLSD
jgi:ribosomal protein S21